MRSSRRRTGCCTQTGLTFLAASSPRGMASTMARTVPQSAICSVRIMALTNSQPWVKSGFRNPPAKAPIRVELVNTSGRRRISTAWKL